MGCVNTPRDGTRPLKPMTTLQEALTEAQKNNRVCPQPQEWQQLYDLLPNKKRIGAGWEPSLPLILAACIHQPCQKFFVFANTSSGRPLMALLKKFIRSYRPCLKINGTTSASNTPNKSFQRGAVLAYLLILPAPFHPTRPRGARQDYPKVKSMGVKVSTHAPTRGATA